MTSSQSVIPLMPRATAVWLIHHTSLTFRQIADSCGLHMLEVQALADGEEEATLQGENPLLNGQLTQNEIDRCTADESGVLVFRNPVAFLTPLKKERKYTPRAYRQDRPDAIAWLLKQYPELSDNQICRLITTTSKTILSIRQKIHPNMALIKPRHPVLLGLCTEKQLDEATRNLQKPTTLDDR